MLEISDIHAGYGGISALAGVSLVVREGEFIAVVGPNGAGKSTLFKCVSGTVRARQGSIRFMGRELLDVAPHDRAHLGIAHVPEGRQVFPSLTVMENLEIGASVNNGWKRWEETVQQVSELFPVLLERRDQLAGTLSGGQQQMLAIARGLASYPQLLMLDEPSMGLAPAIADTIFEAILDIRVKRGLTVLLVEQRAVEGLESCDRGYVLESGRIALEGTREQLLSEDKVRQAYLGL